MTSTLEQLMKQYPGLATKDDRPKMSRHALGAHNLRIILRGRFPGRKFSVRSSTYANGSSLRVSWQDWDLDETLSKDLQREVEGVSELFAYGKPEGMDDGFTYHTGERRAINEALGSVKYVFADPEIMSMEERTRKRAELMDRQLPPAAARKPKPGGRF